MTTYVSKTIAEIRSAIFGRARDKDNGLPKLTNLNPGAVTRGLLELFAWAEDRIYGFLNSVLQQAFPSTSTGKWLDWHLARVELKRRLSLQAEWIIEFTFDSADGNKSIPKGTIVKTKLDSFGAEYRFISKAKIIKPDGQATVNVLFEAEMEGVAYNVGTDTITVLVSSVPGVASITNQAGGLSLAGTNDESDESTRLRYTLRWQEINGMTSGAYKSWAYSKDGVLEVWIDESWPRGRGTVDMYITGAGGIPTQALIDLVNTEVQLKKPATDDAVVKAPGQIANAIDVTIEAIPGYADTAWLSARVTEVLNALFYQGAIGGVTPLKVGEDLLLDRLTFELKKIVDDTGIAPVRRVIITSPANDVQVVAGYLAVLSGTVSVTITVAAEI